MHFKLMKVLQNFQEKAGIWLKEEKVFRCLFDFKDRITWKYGDLITLDTVVLITSLLSIMIRIAFS